MRNFSQLSDQLYTKYKFLVNVNFLHLVIPSYEKNDAKLFTRVT